MILGQVNAIFRAAKSAVRWLRNALLVVVDALDVLETALDAELSTQRTVIDML